jgi:AcrR family transcriptional regulator
MPRISAAREEETRQRILKAARLVFVEKGFSKASIDDVVAACGMSVGAIYNYFPNKDELIRASIDASNRANASAIVADMQAGGTLGERMERAMAGWWKSTVEVPGGPAFLAEAWAEASRRPIIRELMAVGSERATTVAAMFLRQGIASGELPADLDVETLARTYTALLNGLVLEYVMRSGSLRQAEALKSVQLLLGAAVAATGS